MTARASFAARRWMETTRHTLKENSVMRRKACIRISCHSSRERGSRTSRPSARIDCGTVVGIKKPLAPFQAPAAPLGGSRYPKKRRGPGSPTGVGVRCAASQRDSRVRSIVGFFARERPSDRLSARERDSPSCLARSRSFFRRGSSY